MQERNKTCVKCGSEDFIKNGKYTRCQPCYKRQRSARYASRKDEFDEINKAWVKENPDRAKAIKKKWRDNNREKSLDMKKRWSNKNRGKVREYCARRRAQVKEATPSWASRKELQYVHSLAAEKGLVVDHIVPLNSEIVCGLNTPDNLRCIPDKLNTFKGNRYWENMPDDISKFFK